MTSAIDHHAPTDDPGLRARKKRRTREAIVAAAMELFATRGFEGTTIADIAEAADIAPRTFFGYFPSKEAVVFHDHEELLARFAERLRRRRPGESALDALRAWLLSVVAEIDLEDPERVARCRLATETPALAAHERANRAAFEAVLAEAIAADLDVPPTALAPHLAAAAAIATLDALDRYDPGRPLDADGAVALLEEAIAFLQAGLRALGRPPAAPRD